jgi:Uma2 family endonuclease
MHMATKTKRWTLDEVHSLPDDGNKYELVRGALFVTPAPTTDHETVLARLTRLLDPYVATNGLGLVYHPRAVFQFEGSEVEPDLMVRQPPARKRTAWKDAPLPILMVEVFSPYTRRRDQIEKRSLYLDAGIAEYWMVDPEDASITIVRPGREDETVRDQLAWSPRADAPELDLQLADVFGPIN